MKDLQKGILGGAKQGGVCSSPPLIGLKSPKKERVFAEELRKKPFGIGSPKVLPGYHPLPGAGPKPPEDKSQRVIQPNHCFRSLQSEVADHAVISVHHPGIPARQFIRFSAKFLG